MSKEKAEALAKRLKEVPCCPNCGYELGEGDEMIVSDWNLKLAPAWFEDGVLKSMGDWEPTEFWKDEEEIDCPKCDETNPVDDWGNDVEYI